MNPSPGPLKRVGIVANLGKPAAIAIAQTAISLLRSRAEIAIERKFADVLGMSDLGEDLARIGARDIVLVFGGDGTMLATSRVVAPYCTPMLGINLGRFGFLNEVAPETIDSAIEHLLAGDFIVEERMMLEAGVMRDGEAIGTDVALNEFVIGHATLARVLHLSMAVNGNYVTTYAADGIILATPTGSTAYSLSAGGPLVHPAVSAILVTPICPHTLTTRALLVPDTHEVQIEVDRSEADLVQVTVDGQRALAVSTGDVLRVRKASFCARIVTHVGGASFYEKLQNKLRWGERVAY